MALLDELVVRLLVWEGRLEDGKLQKAQIKKYSDHLKSSIDEKLNGTEWRYQIWKTYQGTDGIHKMEIRIRHPKVSTERRSAAIHELCGRILSSDLACHLRNLNPCVSFTFCPSKERTVSTNDTIFARCFSTTVVTRFCVGESVHSKELEEMRDNFLTRNTTKYLHMPMVGLVTLASLTQSYETEIEFITSNIDALVGGPRRIKELGPNILKASSMGLMGVSGPETIASDLKLHIAIACQLIRSFKAVAPDIKGALKPKLEELNEVVLRGRLEIARRAYMGASEAPIEALKRLHALASPTTDDLAMTINAFGSLMQSTLPLFGATLAITDHEFKEVAAWSVATAAGSFTLAGALAWGGMAAAGATGPLALAIGAGAATVCLATTAVTKGISWSREQQTNPSVVLLSIQKSLEECSRFLLGLLFLVAEDPNMDDRSHLEKVQELKSQLSSDKFLKPEYMKAYYKNVSLKLANDMKELATGLERCRTRVH